MGLYNVVKPCVVGNLHHVRPTTQPIEVDDETAAKALDAEPGCLVSYPAIESDEELDAIIRPELEAVRAERAAEPEHKPRARRPRSED